MSRVKLPDYDTNNVGLIGSTYPNYQERKGELNETTHRDPLFRLLSKLSQQRNKKTHTNQRQETHSL
jgi:hypothetical protein